MIPRYSCSNRMFLNIQFIIFMSFNSYQPGIIHFISNKPFHWATLSCILFSTAIKAQKTERDSISTTIQTVEIVGRKSKDYTSDHSFAATKIAMKNKDLPSH